MNRGRLRRRIAACMGSLVLCTGCNVANGPASSPSTARSEQTSDSSLATTPPGLAQPCSDQAVHELVQRFVATFNAGSRDALDQIWAKVGSGFDWYSTDAPGQRIGPPAHDRSTLGAYFATRHAEHETLRLTQFQYNGIGGSYANFQYHLLRTANGLPPTRYVGKGAVYCDDGTPTLGVWSMARDPEVTPGGSG